MMVEGPGGAARLLLLFGALSLAAVVTGVAVAAFSGVPAGTWVRNLAAWAVGGTAAAGIAAVARPGILQAVLWMLPAGLLATFLGQGLDGVHRWLDVGPLHFNVAMLLLPAALVALALLATEQRTPWLAVFASLALLVAQPDASQATTLATVAALSGALTLQRTIARVGMIGAVVVIAAVSWLRPDPLEPVAEVEQIIGLAFALSPVAAGLALLLLIAAAAAPIIATRHGTPPVSLGGVSLGLCLLAGAIMPFLGAFPVPLVGMGMSPIIGAWLGIGLLAAQLRRRDA